MPSLRPTVLTIGGFDPSAGAGVLADIKTFEQLKVYGLAVNTANTIQTEDEFLEFNYLSEALILNQLHPLLNRYKIDYIKIGLIESWLTILEIRNLVKDKTKIVWDPILSISAGPALEKEMNLLGEVLEAVDFVTPNWEEAKKMTGEESEEAGKQLSKNTAVFLKGGHNESALGRDMIFENGTHSFSLKNKSSRIFPKHGSGCVLAAALTAYLAKGFKLKTASLKAKDYTTRFLESNKTLLGYHKR